MEDVDNIEFDYLNFSGHVVASVFSCSSSLSLSPISKTSLERTAEEEQVVHLVPALNILKIYTTLMKPISTPYFCRLSFSNLVSCFCDNCERFGLSGVSVSSRPCSSLYAVQISCDFMNLYGKVYSFLAYSHPIHPRPNWGNLG